MMRPAAALLTAALAAGTLVACGGVVPDLPSGLSVVVYQPRPDVAAGRFAIQVVNDGAEAVNLLSARLSSSGFDADVVWTGDATVLPGRAVDLRVPLPEADCSGATSASVELSADAGSPSGSSPVPLTDPYDFLPRWHAEACLGAAIAELATVTPLEVVVPADRSPAILVIGIVPTGRPGDLEIVGVRGTTLLEPADGGTAVRELPLRVDLAAPSELRVPFLPNRCDAHALAEDKVGTIIPFLVDSGAAEPARWTLVLPDGLRGALHRYYAEYCGLARP